MAPLPAPNPPPISQAILRWRWVILGLGLLGVLAFEILETRLPTEHHWIEFILYGLLIPGGTWLILTALARQVDRQARIERRLAQLRGFIHQVAEHHSSGRLLEFLARYPVLTLPVAEATVYSYDHLQARYQALSAYNAQAGPVNATDPLGPCTGCALDKAGQPQLSLCAADDPAAGPRYCLPLAYQNLTLGRLQLRCAPGIRLSAEHTQTLNTLAQEMSLALMMATVRSQEVTQVGSSARLDERRQLSVTLHNSLAQQVGYLHLSLDRLSGAPPEPLPEAVTQELAGLRDVAGDAYHQIREVLAGLRAPQPHSLVHLLDGRLQAFGRATSLETRLEVHGEPRALPAELSQRIFALVHEGLNNIQKHAAARRVALHVDWQPAELVLELTDDGRGFEPAAAAAAGHYGLTMLREQAAELRGDLAIVSAPGQGTQLRFRLPLSAEAMTGPAPN